MDVLADEPPERPGVTYTTGDPDPAVNGDRDLTVSGDRDLTVTGDRHLTVTGDHDPIVGNDRHLTVSSDRDLTVTGTPDGRPSAAAYRWSRLVWGPAGDPRWVRPALLAIAAVAGVGYARNASHDGLQIYYAAAVRSMAANWRLFWLGGFDPGGQFTIDKLPGAFWIQALVVRLDGLSTTSLVAPQVIAGILAVLVMFRAVRPATGPRIALLAAAALAATPVTAMASRGNIGDGVCVLLLVLAASATARAVATGRLRTLLLASVWVGLAFQVKMVEAWLVLPAFALAYLVAAPGRMRARLGRLGLAGALTLALSLSWMVAVSLIPAGQRPYADGSRTDSVFAEVFQYNGVDRIGGAAGYGLGTGLHYSPSAAARRYIAAQEANLVPPADATRPGWSRLLAGPIGGDAGWLLPLALLVLVAGLIGLRRRPRTDPVRAGLLLWGGWLLGYATVFSAATAVLNYYLATLAPAVAALGALGARLVLDARPGRWLLPAVLLAGAAWPVLLARAAPNWLPWGIGVLAVVGALVAVLPWRRPADVPWLRTAGVPWWRTAGVPWRRTAGVPWLRTAVVAESTRRPAPVPVRHGLAAGLVIGVAGLLLGPAAATATLVAGDGGPYDAPFSPAGTLARPSPRAMVGEHPPYVDGVILVRTSAATWRQLALIRADMNRILDGGRHKILVFSAAGAATYILAGVPGVVPIGGYSGLVDTPSLDALRNLINGGTVQLALVPGPDDLRANDPRILLIESSCVRASYFRASADLPAAAQPRLYVCARA